MQRTFSPGIVAALVLLFVASCSDDQTGAPGVVYEDLTLRDHVLVNLERAWEGRDLEHFQELLDADFVFYFSPTDEANGTVPCSSWQDYADLAAVGHVFDPTYSRSGVDPVTKIGLSLSYARGEDRWQEVTTAAQQKAQGEARYSKIVVYNLSVRAGGKTYTGRGIEATIVVRPVDVNGVTQWRIVEWYDDVGTYGGNASSPAAVMYTWGHVKADYCGSCRYGGLTERDQVLNNLDLAYNERNNERYDELLDADFIFFFSNTDVAKGTVEFDQWGRTREVNSARNLFDPNFSKPGLEPASSINLDLAYAPGDDKWVEVTPPDPVKYPDETWYEKIVTYSLTVKSGGNDFVGNNIQASFTVRWATDQTGKQYWRIVLWRDDTGGILGGPLGGKSRSPLVTPTTWGRVKDVFSG